jgi:hypothetical protein
MRALKITGLCLAAFALAITPAVVVDLLRLGSPHFTGLAQLVFTILFAVPLVRKYGRTA